LALAKFSDFRIKIRKTKKKAPAYVQLHHVRPLWIDKTSKADYMK
jgi:hypothetical protein